MTTAKLWEGLPIQVICGTGEFGVGKTLFGLSIDPGERTLVFDNEGSSTVYCSLGFRHIDMAAEVRLWLRQTKQNREPKPIDRWLWWREHSIKEGESKKYTVCMVDPFSEIENGLADWVMENPGEFGKTKAQFLNASGLYWGSVKDALKAHLDNLRTLYETVYLVTHMRERFSGGRPTGKREPKGKETLFELATLYLKFEREPDGKGNVPAVPSATVLKSRLSHTKIEGGAISIVPVLPPRMPKATPDAIRTYIKTPPDYGKLKSDERVREEKLSDDERLMLQAQEAESRRAAAEAELTLQQEKMKVATMPPQQTRPAPDQAGKAAADKSTASAANNGNGRVTPAVLKQIVDLAKGAGMVDFLKATAEGMGVANPAAMTKDQAEELLNALKTKINAGEVQRAKTALDATADAAPITTEEAAAIVDLAKRAKIVPAVLGEILQSVGVAKITELSQAKAGKVKAELLKRVQPIAPGDNGKSKEAGSVTADQLARLKKLIESVGDEGFPRKKQEEFLSARNVKSFRSISEADCEDLIAGLLKIELGYQEAVGN